MRIIPRSALSIALAASLALVSAAARADLELPRPSPGAKVSQEVGLTQISVDYSCPGVKHRKIWGELVPYDKLWRTGANEATLLKTDTDLVIGGTTIPAGSYTLWTLPSENSWKLIINKQTGQWGTNYDQSQDLARVDMNVSSLPQPVEQFTISFDQRGGDTAQLNLQWEKTQASVEVKEKK